MDERSNLIDQIKGLQDDLRRTRRILLSNSLIHSELRQAIDSRFHNLLNKWERRLEIALKLANSVPDDALNTVWKDLQADRKECDAIFEEFLACLGGALIRQAQLDNGVCTIADKILADLSSRSDIPWTRMTILGEGDFFADMTEIIRLRFPEFTIWNLPIVGHEFGHFVGRELRKRIKDRKGQRDFIKEIIEQEGKQNSTEDEKKKEEDYLYEHLADIFATYSLGPAFAFTSILLKFNPNQSQDGEIHPSNVKRVYIILKTLEKMNTLPGENQGINYQHLIRQLRESWHVSLNKLEESTITISGLKAKREEKTTKLLSDRLDKMYSTLMQEVSNVRYTKEDWLRALSLSNYLCLSEQNEINYYDYQLIDVLNAACICRWLDSKPQDDISEKAINLCHKIINEGQL
ncbi:MAG: hypothetical protein IM507_12545 [Microcystis sp. M20BS1]|uniref:Peptidase M48 domain-containing protein n=1 Tax=Microcystis viridis FACHB-1342 TaxID=2692900 RepID=A0ABR8GC73_MICVR|nr:MULTISPECIES: hypothetical protein [Microcystis]MBD2600932.1 hypothetical protein [Microcystis viridis FACHB-1342]MCA2624927.1 hypothetical protein [Microcystis sp. M19BS1]MCA2633181.1 hypothetical protein [Microcystis sp. M20BS1]ROI08578.1 hypothetical protein ED562_07365 [Microcystis aeruginosa FACHB-524]